MPQLTHDSLEGLPRNGRTDPIDYYRRPLLGYLFRERINIGLRLLGERHFSRALEIGYGAGALLVTLAPSVKKLHGIDSDADPVVVEAALTKRGLGAKLTKGDVYALPYADSSFDLVVCFSVLAQLNDPDKALREVSRVLEHGGVFLLGMPAVNRVVSRLFNRLGLVRIEDNSMTTPHDVARAFEKHGLRVLKSRNLGASGRGPALYYTWLLERA